MANSARIGVFAMFLDVTRKHHDAESVTAMPGNTRPGLRKPVSPDDPLSASGHVLFSEWRMILAVPVVDVPFPGLPPLPAVHVAGSVASGIAYGVTRRRARLAETRSGGALSGDT
ncbi:hypothetical protein AB0395_29415 [Streptosporangium sp. NPDC051023]|uniref:hypothetical protein n=1 Tax=Streptosporangium sp. NPDC051023 TaxID=3155410 RepID=UPI00344B822D